MAKGWVRAWNEDFQLFRSVRRAHGYAAAKRAQANFRKNFTTELKETADASANTLAVLRWSDRLELPGGVGDAEWTGVVFADAGGAPVNGFVRRAHVAEIAYVRLKDPDEAEDEDDRFKAALHLSDDDHADLLWGDMVQIIERPDSGRCRGKARGLFGEIDPSDLVDEALLEVYFIDVGQGDGVLIRFPDGKHMLIDGGLERRLQMTGKNAADFVDWKFFKDYGDWRISLDDMIASHSDADHYGGLHDLIDKDPAALDELDCLEVGIGRFGHPGLSRFPSAVHGDKLGPISDGFFTRLMGDRADAQSLIDGTGADGLKISGWWRSFINATLVNDAGTAFERIGLDSAAAEAGALPVWRAGDEYDVKTLGPVTLEKNGAPALPDLGRTSINTNGHSVCLRIDYRHARVLMTGDLNTASMNWLSDRFGDTMDAWKCDVAKACHHGSHDVSFKFLEAINAAATVISSGDNEGHAHPRPEIVAASALSGHKELSADEDRVITPLIYMTEIERSVLLSTVNRVEAVNLGEAGKNATLLAKPVREFSGREFLDEKAWNDLEALPDDATDDDKDQIIDDATDRAEPHLEATEIAEANLRTRAALFGRRPTGVVGVAYPRTPLWRSRVMEKNIYGLVNVRTDGQTIMCASKRDNGERWTIHAFNARFGA